jgi:hypothetical protein
MTLSELSKWRKYVPFVIITSCLLPWLLITTKTLADAKLANDVVVPLVALIGAFFYVGFDVRGPRWRAEVEAHVGSQIRTALLEMIPNDLEVTEEEKHRLEPQVFKKLTGVFWQAVDRNDILRSHKEHFYSNGIEYSTSIDVYLICGFAGLIYAVAALVTRQNVFAWAGAGCVVVAIAARLLVTPHARARHAELSSEQLELLRTQEKDYVSREFRKIVMDWRKTNALGTSRR